MSFAMENKIKRGALRFVQNIFKQYDPKMTGAIERKDMSTIIKELLKDEPKLYSDDELEEVIDRFSKDSTFIVLSNKNKKEFELGHEEDRLDFPAVMDVIVYYMKKVEKKNNDAFISKHLIRITDFPSP